ncbi:MAG: trypsin-like serine protease [Actinobacteria bacterium]|nr:trypsin-like serine protease [Actinomycetota bacterium]
MRRFSSLLGGVLTAAALFAAAAPVSAITGGEPDGEGHPGVAMIVFYEPAGRFRCTATLVTPTVLITAAHCTEGTIGQTWVTFATDVPGAPRATDDLGTGTSAIGYAPAAYDGVTVTGTAYTHPDYSGFTDLDNWNDVGVIVLDDAVPNRLVAALAPRDYLDAFGQPVLNSTIFTLVGYGTEVRKPESGPQKPTPMSFPRIRRVAESPGQKLTPQIVQMNGNINDSRGTGGTCFGDSGGPAYLNGYIVTVTSYGYTNNCRYIGGYQRIDIAVVQNWLATFGVVPS